MHPHALLDTRPVSSSRAFRLAGVAALAVAALAPSALGAVAVITLSVNQGPPVELVVKNGFTISGAMNFVGSTAVDGVTLSWNYVADLDAFDRVSLNGSSTVTNTTGESVEVFAQISAPICAHLLSNVKLGTINSLKLTSDALGGELTCGTEGQFGGPAPQSVVNALIDGQPQIFCFGCPFMFSSTGGGTITTNCSQGTPLPSLPYAGTVSSIGTRLHVTVTPLDKAILTMFLVVKGDYVPVDPIACPGDMDGDGVVGSSDLAALLQHWNSIDTCGNAGDVNADGIIDGIDLALMLGKWGECPTEP